MRFSLSQVSIINIFGRLKAFNQDVNYFIELFQIEESQKESCSK